MRKTLVKILGIAFCAACVVIPAKNVNAQVGMPCTNTIINNGNAALSDAQIYYNNASAAVAQAQAELDAIVARGGNDIEKTQAFIKLNNAKTELENAKGRVVVAKANVNDATCTANLEQLFLDMKDKWAGRAYIDTESTAVNSIKGQAANALAEVNRLKAVIANASAVDGLKDTIPGLQAQLQKAEANYANLQAQADAMSAQFASDLKSVNWATNDVNNAYITYTQYYKDTYLKDDCWAYRQGDKAFHWYD